MKDKFYKKILVLTLFAAGGVLFFCLDVHNSLALEYSCQCRNADSVFSISASGDIAAHDTCNAQCIANGWSGGAQVVWQVTPTSGCNPVCDQFTEQCRQNPEDGSFSCVPISAGGCPGGCPRGNECRWDDTDRSWSCEPVSGGTTCQFNSDCNAGESCINGSCQSTAGTACQFNSDCNTDESCLNGYCVSSGTGGGGTDDSTGGGGTGPLTRIGNVIMPNFIGYDSISALLGAIANFIINNIAIPFAVIMIIYSGFLFITAGGNEEKIRIARRNLGWTVLGVAIILASKVLIDYITELLGGPSGGVQPFLKRIKGTLNQLIVVFFALATVYFIWGIVQFLRATGSGNEEGIKTGKKHMIWGIIGMAIMGGALGIVNIIAAYVR